MNIIEDIRILAGEVHNRVLEKVASNVGYYPTLPSRIEECSEIGKGDNNTAVFLQ